MSANPKSGKKLRVTLLKSHYGTGKTHMACVRGLGLRRRHHMVEVEDTPAVRGMIHKVSFMVKCEEI
ncbi:MAG: 50S ribosomal protein L30 [Candidatus Muproteobacteria bacterium RBG_16_65_34]|uniref:Large ribosomal subunit protein uL30 n=1 Tax=Candidatus Muproteobacteria bacterium RBG_16_65_34 TaxID=1817760 RepID=A0A1F6TMI3_9PROT|nr:MAG: 50S ribosomal protein L30 [Candidatus Muproteobacteria bacterium RBG_16_65_34]